MHGSVVWARALTGPAVLKAARRNILVIYRSGSPLGKTVFVSGTVAIPRGNPPKGGWPVIAWNHGATGIADVCAPSRGYSYNNDLRSFLASFLRRGFAVVATDYQGLGTPGVHPWIIGRAEGHDVIDMVSATRALDRSIGRRWLSLGASQGGHAALWSAALAAKWAPRLRLVGAVSLAPTSHGALIEPAVAKLTKPVPYTTGPLATYIIGASTVGWNPNTVLSHRGQQLIAQLYTHTCYQQMDQPGVFGGVAPAELFRPDADLTTFTRILAANDPGTLKVTTPIFMGQGTKDTAVFRAWTDDLVAQLRKHGANIEYRLYPVTHYAPELAAAYDDYSRFIAARFHHR